MKKEKKNKQKKKKIKSLDLQMTLNKDLTAALRFKNVACQSVSVPLRDPYIVVAIVTVVTCLSHGWFQSAVGSYGIVLSYYTHTEPYIFRHVW